MAAFQHDGAAPGRVTPESDEAPAVGTAQGFQEGAASALHSASAPNAVHVRVIEGQRKAREFLALLHAQQQPGPDELALIVSMLYGATLRGFCAVITKALRGGVA